MLDFKSRIEESDEIEAVKALVEYELLDGVALDTCCKLVKFGFANLTDDQREIYESQIAPKLRIECGNHGELIPINEVADAILEDDGLCAYCRSKFEGDDSDYDDF